MEKRRDRRRRGEEFPRSKYVICSCPEPRVNDTQKYCRAIDADYTIGKLRELVSDPATGDHISRISQLLRDYLHEIGDKGYLVKHLPAVMRVLEFVIWKSREVEVYRAHLDRMLRLCSLPPLLERTSDSLVNSLIMEHYFSSLGYLLTILPNKEQIQRIHEALDCLLTGRTKPTNIRAVKLDFRRRAMENSRLPIIIVQLLEAALPKMYSKIVELAFVLASVSYQCCHKMLEAGILNTLLVRMDLPYATQLRCTKPPGIPLEGEEYPWETMLLITNLLWSLMRSMLLPKKLSDRPGNFPSIQQCAMWGLSYSFKRQIFQGQYSAVNLRIRNDIAALILAGILIFPSWNIITNGILEDIVGLLDAIEYGYAKIWAEDVKFSDSEEDFLFKRILLMIIAHVSRIDVCVFVMKKAMIMPIILRIIKSSVDKYKKSSSWSILLEHAMYVLSLLASRIAGEFVKRKGTLTLLTVVDQILSTKIDEHLTVIFTRTICSIILQNDPLLLKDFRKHEMIPLLIKLISNIIGINKLTMRRQRILTLLLVILDGLVKEQTSVQQMYGEQSVEIIEKIFAKCLYVKSDDFQVDQRLLLATGSYIWQCVANYPANRQIFLKNNGVYSMLDIIEIANYPVRCLYLGALTDICDFTFCGPCLCTWRGADKKTGLISLFASLWREEEDRIGIKRRADNSIADPELPQMGTKQWMDTYRSRLTADASPTIIDMIGSVRSKIFSILKIIERDGDKYETAKKHYKILLNGLPIGDSITLCCIDMYLRFKLGQMWTELSRYLEQTGITPLNIDAELISHMVQWHRSWGILVEERQKKLVSAAKRIEEIHEMDGFAKIRDSKLALTLEALDRMDHIRRTTDRSYMLWEKDRQRQQVNAALFFPQDADVERCHRTFPDEANFTVILGQHQSIDSSHPKDSLCDTAELPLVSPSQSLHEKTFSSFDDTSSISLFHELQFSDEYPIEKR